jgi:hypothetical protein
MDRTLNTAVYLGIVSLGAYVCSLGFRERRAAILGICLIAFGVAFAWFDQTEGERSTSIAPNLPGDI